MDEDEDWNKSLADEETLDRAQADLDQAIAKIDDKYNLLLPDVVMILITTAVHRAFDIWGEGEGGLEVPKMLIQDTVAACLEAEAKRGQH